MNRYLMIGGLAIAILSAACASTVPVTETKGSDSRSDPITPLEPWVSHGTWMPPVAFPAREVPGLGSRLFVVANRAREERGLDALEMRQDLMEVAESHAREMARLQYFSHYSAEGLSPGQRADRRKIDFTVYAENLARVRHGEDPALLAVRGWLASPGHRRNLLDERAAGYRYTGIGVARDVDGAVYIAQVYLR